MRIVDESIMTTGKVNDYCINKVILCDKFKEFIEKLYNIKDNPFNSGVNGLSVSVDLSFAINSFNKRSAVSRPIRNVIHVTKNYLNKSEEAFDVNPYESILIELNGDLYNISESKKYSREEGYLYTEDINEGNIQITPSPLYHEIVEYFENSTVIDNC